jgi:sigma-B regulation protein RsbU (phosphoserine phosphatase)
MLALRVGRFQSKAATTLRPGGFGMDRKKLRRLKFEMGGANFLANLVGAVFVQSIASRLGPPIPEHWWRNPLIEVMDIGFTPFAFSVIILLTHRYEKPIQRYLDALAEARPIPPAAEAEARRRLLNEPFLTIVADFAIWVLASVAWGFVWWLTGAPAYAYQQTIFNCLSIGLITVTLVFFLQEHILQKRLVPLFFPSGGLSSVPKTLRIRIRTRLAALLLAINLIPLCSVLFLYYRVSSAVHDPQTALGYLKGSVVAYCLIFIAAGVFLTGLVSRNLTIPFHEIISTLQGVRNGRFEKKVRVTTNDELGFTGDAINEMTRGLQERERMRQALDLAMEVQQNLLPKSPPRVPGLDIAGGSVYCEETGGDYFDYLERDEPTAGTITVVVGDVSDHGLPSAMLMTTARAFLRQRASRPGSLAEIVTDVNRLLCRDVQDTGRFMTLLVAEIDRPGLKLRWVNAGHDPAVLCGPRDEDLLPLGRTGLPLGVTGDGAYSVRKRSIAPGQILVIGTDGIWEAQNGRAEMFGKKRFLDVIRAHAASPAKVIRDAITLAVDEFCHPLQKVDDITLVVVKVSA